MADFWLGVLASFLGGSFTAFTFFMLFRPTLKISDKIARIQLEEGHYYKFKFYNTSIFPAIDVKPTLFYGIPKERSEVNTDMKYDEIDFTRLEPFYVEKWKRTGEKTKNAPHCIKIKCENQDFEKLLHPYGAVLEIRINVKHGFSNISRTITKRYNRKEVIEAGDFIFGNNFDIS